MKHLFSNNNKISKKLIFIYIIISLIKFSKNIISEENIIEINDYNNKYFIIKEENKSECIEINLEEAIDDFSLLQNSLSYIHFSANSLNNNKLQIIYNLNSNCLSEPEIQKSIDFSEKSNLFVKFINQNIYFNVQCLEYPCEFYFSAKIEKDFANLNYDNLDTYSYFMTEDIISSMAFKIPSLQTKDGALTISISNPTDIDYIQLYLVKDNDIDNKQLIEDNIFKSKMEIIFFVIEGIEKKEKLNENDFYVLEIDSMKNQYVSISIKNSSYDTLYNSTKEFKLESKIIKPNSSPKYSYLSYENICDEINDIKKDNKTNPKKIEGIKDNKNNDNIINLTSIQECYNIDMEINNNDLVYASIDYFTQPIYPFLIRNGDIEILKEEFPEGQNSINLILNKASDENLDICFKITENQELAFKIEISQIKKNEKYININGPLTSGSFHTETLLDETSSLYTHISDIQDFEKLTFYLKVLKGSLTSYMIPCNNYPNCSHIDNSELKPEFKLNKIDTEKNTYSYYSYTNYTKRKTDLSPFGNNQNLLYIKCSSKDEQYCQFQILIYSELDEIIPFKGDTFFSVLQESETELYRIKIPKNDKTEKIRVIIKSLEYVEFNSLLENSINLNVNTETILNSTICDFIPLKSSSLESKDLEIAFNVKSNNNGTKYNITYDIIKKDETSYNIYNLTVGKIKELYSINSLPIKIFSKINNKGKDLYFNFYFKSMKSEILNSGNFFDEMEIKAALINEELLNKSYLNENENFIDFNNKNKLFPSFDLSTKSIYIYIKNDLITNNDILYITINKSKKNNERIRYTNLSGKFFLFYRNDIDFIIPINNYVTDILTSENNCNSYHIQLKEKKNYTHEFEFSSNVDLQNLNMTFHDPDINKNLVEGKDFTYIKGAIHLYKFKFSTTYYEKNIILYISPKIKIDYQINFIFKYNLYSLDDYRIDFDKFNNEQSQHISYDDHDDSIIYLELKKISRINRRNETEANEEGYYYIKGEVYIRKIFEADKKEYENLSALSRINSKYELIKGNLRYKSDDEIEIIIPIKKTEREMFSVIVDFPENNEKYAYYQLTKTVIKEDSRGIETWELILILLAICIVLIGILIVCKLLRNRKNNIEIKITDDSIDQGRLVEEMKDY